jgi:serine/threonine protein kinase
VRIHPHTSFGRYCVEREIGRGAMGIVYSARDPNIDRVVAIKTISLPDQDAADEAEFRERFLLEARAAGRLSHPGMITIFDAGEDPETHVPFIVMEYVGGQPLSQLLRDAGGKLDATTALQFAFEIAEALAYAHSQGVVHGDIKPANILITEDGHAKIADFGVARLNHGLVRPGAKIFGSPAYMAPEQLSGASADARSDLFSLGVMLYSMLTGFRPFQGNSAETVSFKVMNVEPIPVSSFQAELAPGLDRIVSRAIAKEPRDRYQSGSEFADEVGAFINSAAASDIGALTARSVPHLAAGISEPFSGLEVSRAFLWQAATIILLSAGLLTAWQIKNDFQAAASKVPPLPSLPHAPAVQKTPPAMLAIRKVPRQIKIAPPVPEAGTPVVENAKLRVEILHHFAAGKASLWIDDQLVLDQNLHGDDHRHPVFHVVEMNQMTNVLFAPGKHTLQIHVVAPPDDYDQTEKLEAEITLEKEHVLVINCDKKKIQVDIQ